MAAAGGGGTSDHRSVGRRGARLWRLVAGVRGRHLLLPAGLGGLALLGIAALTSLCLPAIWPFAPPLPVLGIDEARQFANLTDDLWHLHHAVDRLRPTSPDGGAEADAEAVAELERVLIHLEANAADLGPLERHQHARLVDRLRAGLRVVVAQGRALAAVAAAAQPVAAGDVGQLRVGIDAVAAMVRRLFLATSEDSLRALTADRRKLEQVGVTIETLLIVVSLISLALVLMLVRARRSERAAASARQRLDDAIESITDGFILWDQDDRLILCNRRFRELYHEMADQLRPGARFEALLHQFLRAGGLGDQAGDAHDRLAKRLRERRLAGRGGPFERRLGDGRWVRIAKQPTTEGGLVAIHTDITTVKAREQALRDSEERYRLLAETSPVGIAQIAPDHRLVYANPAFCRLLEADGAETLLGRSWGQFIHPEDRARAHRERRRRDQGVVSSYEIKIIGCRGQRRQVLFTGTPLPAADGSLAGILITLLDISERKAAEQQAQHLAHHDALTGLCNRVLFGDRLAQALRDAERNGGRFAVVALDLDNFKDVNDSLGHAVGDAVLQLVATRLRRCLRAVDTVARLSGDEFALVVLHAHRAEAVERLAAKIVVALGEPYEVEDHLLHLSASVGIAHHPEHGQNGDELLRHADMALYRAKSAGGNGHAFFEPVMSERMSWRKQLEAELRLALQSDAFHLVYQPQVDLRRGRITGVEALLRWQHPERGNIPPGEFIPVAEASGLVVPLGHWVLRTACRQLRDWFGQGLPPVRMSINLSTLQIRRPELVEVVADCLATSELEPEWLELEITESVLMEDSGSARQTLGRLRALGVGLSLDDFGTGYSSLGYLKRFPVDRIKIDRSFVADIGATPADDALVTAMIALAHSLGMTVIAEGIEAQAQLDFLRAHGCDLVQGYHLGRPMLPEQLADALTARPVAGADHGALMADAD